MYVIEQEKISPSFSHGEMWCEIITVLVPCCYSDLPPEYSGLGSYGATENALQSRSGPKEAAVIDYSFKVVLPASFSLVQKVRATMDYQEKNRWLRDSAAESRRQQHRARTRSLLARKYLQQTSQG
jgi:hypothetical protein